MTPESGVLLALVITISVCGIFTACVCCMCCCVASVWNAMVEKFFGRKGPIFGNGRYQMVPPTNSFGYQQSGGYAGDSNVTANAVYAGTVAYSQQSEDIPMVEAYVVPPLAAQCSSDAQSLVHRGGVVEEGNSLLTSANSRPTVTAGAKDVWAGILFIFNVVVIFALAVQSITTLNTSGSSSSADGDGFDLGKTGINFPMLSLYLTMTLLIISAAGSYLVYFFLNHGEHIIDWVMKLNIAGLFFIAVVSLCTLEIFGAIIFGIMAGVNLWYYYSVRSRIPFASSVLAAACTSVKANFTGLLLTSFAGLMFQGLWMLLWSIALFGVYTTLSPSSSSTSSSSSSSTSSSNDDNNDSGTASFVSFILLFSLYWGLQLIKDVVAVTAGGTVATWWFQPKHPAPVRGSLFRATTSSFGSICFGSMIVAIVTSLRVIVKSIVDKDRRNRGRNGGNNFLRTCLFMILESMLRCLENILKYINKYAYSYVAAYGYDFVTAGKSVLQLFEERGWSTIINDDLISNALFLFAMFMAVIGIVVGLLLTLLLLTFHSDILAGVLQDSSSLSTVYVLGGVYGGLVGLVVGTLIVSILDSSVAMVYVCFAEDSGSLQAHHPEVFRDLSTKWSLFQPPLSPAYSEDNLTATAVVVDAHPHVHAPAGSMMMAPMGNNNVTTSALHAPYHQDVMVQGHPGGRVGGYNPHYVAPQPVTHYPPKGTVVDNYAASTSQYQGPSVAPVHRPPPVNPNFQGGLPSTYNNNQPPGYY